MIPAIPDRAVRDLEQGAGMVFTPGRVVPGRERARWPVVVVVVGALLPVAWLWWTRIGSLSDGTLTQPVPGRSDLTITAVYSRDSLLRPGDVVRKVDGIGLNDWVSGSQPTRSRHEGDRLTYTVVRHGVTQDVTVRVVSYPFAGVFAQDGILLLLVVTLLVFNGAVFLLRPHDRAAQAMMIVSLALPWVIPEFPLGLQIIDFAGGTGLAGFLGADLAACVVWGGLLYFTLVFPEPVGPLERRPGLAWLVFALPFALWVLSWTWTLPFAHSALARTMTFYSVSTTASRVVPLLAGLRLVISYRQARDPDVRRRLRWIIVTLLIFVLAYLGLFQLPYVLGDAPLIGTQWLILTALPAPLAVAAAILRYRLFDIEVILTRSLLVGALTVGVAGAYTAAVLLVPRLGIGSSSLVLLLAGSAISAAAFGLRRTLTRKVTALVYGDRSDPHAVVAQLSELDTDAPLALAEVVSTLAAALRIPYVRLELLGDDGAVQADAEFGRPVGVPTVLAIGAGLGRLELGVGAGREPFGPADRRLLAELSRQLAGAARTVLLAGALQQSRERIVLAREEERRRLRRDLHDGIGPTLAAQAMQLEVAARMMQRSPVEAADLLSSLGSATHGLIAEVRRIVEDLRPAALDQLGLVSAIRESTQSFEGVSDGFVVAVEAVGDLGDLPAAVEVAAFRIAVEAVTNAARYSGGHRCVVRLHRRVGLQLLVIDDGQGLQATTQGSGVGLGSMRERARELGGSCTIRSAPGLGTTVDIHLPIRDRSAP